MIKNEYLQNYLKKKQKITEFEKENLSHDDNRLIYLQRPLSQREILKIPKLFFKKFLEDIISNKKVNNLLYSSNAKKEILYNIKQTKFVKNATKYYFKRSSFSSKGNNCQNLFFKKKKAEMYHIIKTNINDYKKNKKTRMKILDKKNKSFENINKKNNELKKKLEIKKNNLIKINGYKRAVEACFDKSSINRNFKVPDNSFDINDVFNRLYNNVILDPVNLNIKNTETTNYNNIKTIRKIKIEDNNKKNYLSSENINRFNTYKGIKNLYDNYTLKNILTGYDGKEFATEKNFNDYAKCVKKISGGPKIKRKMYDKMIKRLIKDKKINDNEKEFNIDSYRDKDNNSFLNIAVKKNKPSFVRYFLNKKYNPNEPNKDGNTALHLSMKRKNRKIIKLLLDKNADITIKNREGFSSYDLADKDLRNEFKMENILVSKRPKKYYY